MAKFWILKKLRTFTRLKWKVSIFSLCQSQFSPFFRGEPNLVLPCLFNRSMVTSWQAITRHVESWGFLQSHHGAWNALSPGVPGHSFLGLKSDKVYRFSVGGMRGFSKRYLSACIYKIWPLGPETRAIKASGIFHAVRWSFLSGDRMAKSKPNMQWIEGDRSWWNQKFMTGKAGFFWWLICFFCTGQRLGSIKKWADVFWGGKVGLTTSMVKSQDNIISNLT